MGMQAKAMARFFQAVIQADSSTTRRRGDTAFWAGHLQTFGRNRGRRDQARIVSRVELRPMFVYIVYILSTM